MNLILATGRLFRKASIPFKSTPSVRGAIYLDNDWMPGEYPKTEEERRAAAKKYNLLPEEYEPYDPEKWEMACGDYPKLPNLHYSDFHSDQAWDYVFHRHNYMEPWHAYYENYQWWTPEMHDDQWFPFSEIFLVYAIACGLLYAYCAYREKNERIIVFKPLHTVTPGEIHYHYPNSKIEMYEEGHGHHH